MNNVGGNEGVVARVAHKYLEDKYQCPIDTRTTDKVDDDDNGISEEEVEEFVESLPFRPVENLQCLTKNCPNLRLKYKENCPDCLFKLYGSY